MTAETSLFQFDDFFILRYSCEFIDPGKQQEVVKVKSITDKYIVDVDFTVVKKEDEKKWLTYCKLSINNGSEKKLPGYAIFVEGVGVFSTELGKELAQPRYINEIQMPAIAHGINHLRNYIMNTTAQGPFGKYVVPFIDLGKMLNLKAQKAAQSQKATAG